MKVLLTAIEEIYKFRGYELNVDLISFINEDWIEVEERTDTCRERVNVPVKISYYKVIITCLRLNHPDILDFFCQRGHLFYQYVNMPAITCFMRRKEASFIVEHDFPASLEKLFHELLMLLGENVWHDFANILANDFLLVPP